MGISLADRKASRAIATAVHVWVLTAAGLGTGVIAARAASPTAPSSTTSPPATPASATTAATATADTAAADTAAAADSLWAVAYSVEYRDAGYFRLVYAGYLRPVTAGRPAATRIETAPDPKATGTSTEGTGIAIGNDSRTASGWPDGVTITAAELAAALRLGHDPVDGSPPPSREEVCEGTVLLLLARPPEDGLTVGPPGHPPASLVLLTPLVMFLDPEGTAYRRQLVENLLQQLSVPVVSYSSGPSPGVPPKPPAVLPAGPGI